MVPDKERMMILGTDADKAVEDAMACSRRTMKSG
jgi:hypothetical protein